MSLKSLKIFLVFVFCAIFLYSLASKIQAAGTIGYIDVQRVFNEYKETKKAKEMIGKEEENYKKELEKRKTEIEGAQKNKNLKESEINDLVRKKEAELDPLKEKLAKLNQELITQIQKNIVAATQEVAKKLGIDLVLDKQVVITGGLDLSEQVIYRLNQAKLK